MARALDINVTGPLLGIQAMARLMARTYPHGIAGTWPAGIRVNAIIRAAPTCPECPSNGPHQPGHDDQWLGGRRSAPEHYAGPTVALAQRAVSRMLM
jgi:hypothetical protein